MRRLAGVVAAVLLAGCAAQGSGSTNGTGATGTTISTTLPPVTAAPTTVATLPPTTEPPTTLPTPKILLSVSGTGIKSTEKFTTPGEDWDLAWSYNCASFGFKGNFAVTAKYPDGSFFNVVVNELGMSGVSVEHLHQGGTFYLEMNSECHWSVKVTG